MNARREPHLLQVGGQFGKEFAFTVALPVGVNGFEHTAYAQVVTAVLVEQDVASLQCCLLQIIDKRFFLERQFFKSFHFVAKHLNIGKLLIGVLKVVFHLVLRQSCGA
ncbi:unknown [Prevotella sp. CAG:891]|nr:unknown [Prevotella sp. CAG:891]